MLQETLSQKLWLINGHYAFNIRDLDNENARQVLRDVRSSIEQNSELRDIVYFDVVSKEEIDADASNYEWLQSPVPDGQE